MGAAPTNMEQNTLYVEPSDLLRRFRERGVAIEAVELNMLSAPTEEQDKFDRIIYQAFPAATTVHILKSRDGVTGLTSRKNIL